MSRTTVRILTLIWAVATIATASAQTDSVAAKGGLLKLKEHTVILDQISGDSIVYASFTLYNAGDEDVEIIRIISDCSCSVPQYTPGKIAPGDSLKFDVKFDPRGYRWGRFHRILRIRSTAVNPYLSAVIKGTIAKRSRKKN